MNTGNENLVRSLPIKPLNVYQIIPGLREQSLNTGSLVLNSSQSTTRGYLSILASSSY